MFFNLLKATSQKIFKLLINVSSQLIDLFNKIHQGFLRVFFGGAKNLNSIPM